MTERFEAYCRRKEAAALQAEIPGYTTAEDSAAGRLVGVGSPWSRALFDGDFYRSEPAAADLPSTNLVFVQSRRNVKTHASVSV